MSIAKLALTMNFSPLGLDSQTTFSSLDRSFLGMCFPLRAMVLTGWAPSTFWIFRLGFVAEVR